MLLLACEHFGEAKPFIEYFNAKKKGGLFIADDLAIYSNYGKGGLALTLNTSKLYDKLLAPLCVLFGIAGNLTDLKINEVVNVYKAKLIDSCLKPIQNPVELTKINGFKNVEIVSVLGNYALGANLSYFADSIDKESYFFSKAINELKLNGLIIKLISDNNEQNLFNTKIKLDYTKVFEAIDFLKDIAKNNLSEIFLKTGVVNLNILNGIKRLFDKKRFTFTVRQDFYKKIKINTSVIQKKPFKLKIKLCDENLNNSCIKIDDYVSYFHNLKDKCGVIFAHKRGEFLRKTPEHYTPDGNYGYSILQSYNCIYDCSYCFLKGYFRTFNPVIFKNIKDFLIAIKRTLDNETTRPLYFYIGTFSDPIALSVFDSSYIEFASFFEHLDAILEIRTKSVMIDKLLKGKPFKHTIIAYSLSPQSAIDKFEYFTPSLKRRLNAIKLLDKAGFKIGIRFDPFFTNYLNEYKNLVPFLNQIEHLHSIEIGALRFSKNEYKAFLDINPAVLSSLALKGNMYMYNSQDIKQIVETLFHSFKDKIYYMMF